MATLSLCSTLLLCMSLRGVRRCQIELSIFWELYSFRHCMQSEKSLMSRRMAALVLCAVLQYETRMELCICGVTCMQSG